MRSSFLLLKIIAKAALHASGVGGLWSIVEDVPELAYNVWNEWKAARNPAERRADLEAVANLEDGVTPDIERIVAEVAADQPAPVRQELAAYLAQVPASVRQTLRRPADPKGRTVSPALEPQSGDDLIPFLTARRPRFRPGDRPIPGADWVLVELLGIGGFGEVWKAKHFKSDDVKPVALKFCTEAEARKTLDREFELYMRLCGRLMEEGTHPGIVRLRETYLSAEPPCLCYEYVEGGNLAGLIKDWARREPRPSPVEITRHLLAITKIMAFVHALKPPIVHRDLKPANILISGTNDSTRFKIADFGIGGIASSAVVRAKGQPADPSLLLTKGVGGSHSPIYASPEQAAGGRADPRDDVHALGVVWYQMLTGNLAIGPTGGDAWRAKLEARGMSRPLIRVLVACLEEAGDRIPNAGVLCQQIESALAPLKKDGPSVQPWVVVALFLALFAGVYYFATRDDTPPPEVARVNPPAAPSTIPEIPERRATPAPPPANETEITNTLGMKLALIPADEFDMGSNNGDSDEKPVHRVKITRPFYLGTTEVTQGQYRAVTGTNPSYFKGSDDLPVEQVSWLDAIRFCNALSTKEGLTPFYRLEGDKVSVPDWKGPGYRLPTEAEWEYAYRAGPGGAGAYSFGDDATQLDRHAWYRANSEQKTHPVARKAPNAWGLFDMHGNVYEWCWDVYAAYEAGSVVDPIGPSNDSNRVIRGGSWSIAAEYCRAAYRSRSTPTFTSDRLGLRLARVPSGK